MKDWKRMKRQSISFLLAMYGGLAGIAVRSAGQSAVDYAVQVSVSVQTNPPRITLSWPADPNALSYTAYRKLRDDLAWGAGTGLGANATSYVDTSVARGSSYEYRISKSARNGSTFYSGNGYLYAGIEAPLVEDRGKLVLLVDNTQSPSLPLEMTRLQQDLVGDGWTVLRFDVSRTAGVTTVKNLIVTNYNADPAHVRALFLFGHVPVPYSGNLNPDGHPEHLGAWPADLFYADVNGVWTDTTVSNVTASRVENHNVPGDGKFDQSSLPSDADLQVGRVDLANFSLFSASETELLRQYLNKDHNFRFKFITAAPRGLITDNFGAFGGEAFAASGWRSFSACFGAANVVPGDWFPTLTSASYLWAYGCGPGWYSGASGVASTTDFAATQTLAVFTLLFGSYFGDFDAPDDFLRAPLAAPGYALTCAWAGRPHWFLHHMGLGETIGFSTRLSQNNPASLYSPTTFARQVHIALMGDPALRLQPVAPPAALVLTPNNGGGVDLSWNPSPDSVAGYHVYRAAAVGGPFGRLNGSVVVATNFTDSAPLANAFYMVRAVRLETSASGTYWNASQGIFQNRDGSFGTPALRLVAPSTNTVFMGPASVPMEATVLDLANGVTRVEFLANGVKLGESTTIPFTLTWSNALPGSYTLTARAVTAQGQTTDSPGLNIFVGPFLTATRAGANLQLSWPSAAAGYQLESTPMLVPPTWSNVTNQVLTANGTNSVTVGVEGSGAFYRLGKP
jgi:hypothetical protein